LKPNPKILFNRLADLKPLDRTWHQIEVTGEHATVYNKERIVQVVDRTALEMILGGTLPTQVVLFVLFSFSLASWWLIFHKWRQFREVRLQGDEFLSHMERAQRLEDAYKAILSLPESPYGRVFRQGVNFFSELRPGALRQGAEPSPGLSLTQLEALRLVLEKEEAEERDELARGLTWLAVIGSVSPLMDRPGRREGLCW
jgi:biopolymer transport protein TolQ